MLFFKVPVILPMFLSMLIITNRIFAKCEWFHPTHQDVRTIYYQGVHASQAQVSKYTGTRGFIATTGEYVICKKGFDVIENPYIGTELEEIHLKKVYQSKRAKIKAFFRHPVRTLEQCMNTIFENKLFGISIDRTGKSQKETLKAYSVDISAMSLAQGADIIQHQARYDLCLKEYPDSDIILYGVSRGAATTFNACATNHYNNNKIRLIILEGCFDSIPGIIHSFPLSFKSKSLEKFFVKRVSALTQFQAKGLSPISMVEQFPVDIPVVFITSLCDHIVPMVSVERMVDALKRRGKNPLYLLVLKHSSHPKYMIDNKEDTENYRDFLHILYKSLNLSYIPEYAESGEKKGLLQMCRVM